MVCIHHLLQRPRQQSSKLLQNIVELKYQRENTTSKTLLADGQFGLWSHCFPSISKQPAPHSRLFSCTVFAARDHTIDTEISPSLSDPLSLTRISKHVCRLYLASLSWRTPSTNRRQRLELIYRDTQFCSDETLQISSCFRISTNLTLRTEMCKRWRWCQRPGGTPIIA